MESRITHSGKGRYKGYKTPLDFFRAHEEYHGLTRYELSLRDSGLYKTLLKHGQLKEAIPETFGGKGRPPLTKEQILEIIESHKKFKGNAEKVSIFLGFSSTSIINYWRKNGLRINKSGCKGYYHEPNLINETEIKPQ